MWQAWDGLAAVLPDMQTPETLFLAGNALHHLKRHVSLF